MTHKPPLMDFFEFSWTHQSDKTLPQLGSALGRCCSQSPYAQALCCLGLLLLTGGLSLIGQEIRNGLVTVRAVKTGTEFSGFDVLAPDGPAAAARLSSALIQVRAATCEVSQGGNTLTFGHLHARADCGLDLGKADTIRVSLAPNDPYPVVSFQLKLLAFDPQKWKATVGQEPFHFLSLYLPEAEAWHQRGWLNATPKADRFPLLQDRHAGTPEISAYHYNRNWSYTPPLGANPLPVIGLWAPGAQRYVGLEFQSTRLEDNSERDIATGYRWVEGGSPERPDEGQFVALVYPFGGNGYQQLVLPKPGTQMASHGTLLWSRQLPASGDPNWLLWSFLWGRCRDQLPLVPSVPDLAWIPGGLHLANFEGPPGGALIGGVENPFQVPGTRLLYGWTWHNESPTAALARGNTNRLHRLEAEARELVSLAKVFRDGGEDCVYWEKPLTGQWTETWGGKPVTTLHNANGFAAGRLFLGLYRDVGKSEYLPVVDGVLNWAKHIVWTRNEFADVPSSPFAIGGTLSASFCLDYYMTFKNAPDALHRARAQQARDLAQAFTYRYLVMWPSDNNRLDHLDSAFLWEPNSGRDWTGAACANEVFWNLDTLAQTAVHTGDPVLCWALQGSLSRWHQLYQEVYKDQLAQYQAKDMTEGYGLYAGCVYGVGRRAGYGFAAPLVMTEPVGNSRLRVLAGEQAALVFRKGATPVEIADYRYLAPGNLAFTLRSAQPRFDVSLTVPYVDLSQKPVTVLRHGSRRQLEPGRDFQRPPQALWSLYLRDLEPEDRVIVGEGAETAPLLPCSPPLSQAAFPAKPSPTPAAPFTVAGYQIVPLLGDQTPDTSWAHHDAWAGLPRGRFWAYGVPFELAADRPMLTRPLKFNRPLRRLDFVYLLYSAGSGPAPTLQYENDGQHNTASDRLEALAWRAWPPIYDSRLVLAQIPVHPGQTVTGLDPGGRSVWACTTLKVADLDPTTRPSATQALAQGAAEWRRSQQEEVSLQALRAAFETLAPKTVAILPPAPSGPAWAMAERARLPQSAVVVEPKQLVDPSFFNARAIPVAVYLDGEDYLHTVATPGDAAAALMRYVHEGGTLVLLASQPWPLYYAVGPNFHRAEPLTVKLGLPLTDAVEGAPGERLTLHLVPGQSFVQVPTQEWPYPEGDPRLRTIVRTRIPPGAHYTPIVNVAGERGRDYGDAAALIELPGGGRVLYLASILQHDPERQSAFLAAAWRVVVAAAHQSRPEPHGANR